MKTYTISVDFGNEGYSKENASLWTVIKTIRLVIPAGGSVIIRKPYGQDNE